MEERDIIKYGIIVVVILSAIGITFHFLSSSSHNTPSISQLSKKINVTIFKIMDLIRFCCNNVYVNKKIILNGDKQKCPKVRM